jgi:hypothetical protein
VQLFIGMLSMELVEAIETPLSEVELSLQKEAASNTGLPLPLLPL